MRRQRTACSSSISCCFSATRTLYGFLVGLREALPISHRRQLDGGLCCMRVGRPQEWRLPANPFRRRGVRPHLALLCLALLFLAFGSHSSAMHLSGAALGQRISASVCERESDRERERSSPTVWDSAPPPTGACCTGNHGAAGAVACLESAYLERTRAPHPPPRAVSGACTSSFEYPQ